MTFKKIIGLGIVVGLMALFIFNVEVPRQQQEQDQQLFLSGATDKELQRIAVSATQDSFELQNLEQQSWKLSSVPSAILDQGAVSTLVNALVSLSLGDPIPSEDIEGDLAPYGLKDPELQMEVSLKVPQQASSVTKKIEFGKRSEYLGERYIRIPETGSVYLVPDTLFFYGSKGSDYFRDKTPLKIESSAVTGISILRTDGVVKLERQEQGWTLLQPFVARASDVAVANLLNRVRALEVKDFHDEENPNLSQYGLESPDVILQISQGDVLNELKFSSPVDPADGGSSFFSYTPFSTIFEGEGTKLGDFIVDEAQLMDKKILNFDQSNVQALTIRLNGDELQLTKSSDDQKQSEWSVDQENGDTVFIENYLRDIAETEIDKPVVLAQDAEFKSILEVTINFSDGTTDKFSVGPSEVVGAESFHRVQRDSWKGIYRISEESYSKLLPKRDGLIKAPSSDSAG